jgi:hypothetical protein
VCLEPPVPLRALAVLGRCRPSAMSSRSRYAQMTQMQAPALVTHYGVHRAAHRLPLLRQPAAFPCLKTPLPGKMTIMRIFHNFLTFQGSLVAPHGLLSFSRVQQVLMPAGRPRAAGGRSSNTSMCCGHHLLERSSLHLHPQRCHMFSITSGMHSMITDTTHGLQTGGQGKSTCDRALRVLLTSGEALPIAAGAVTIAPTAAHIQL